MVIFHSYVSLPEGNYQWKIVTTVKYQHIFPKSSRSPRWGNESMMIGIHQSHYGSIYDDDDDEVY